MLSWQSDQLACVISSLVAHVMQLIEGVRYMICESVSESAARVLLRKM